MPNHHCITLTGQLATVLKYRWISQRLYQLLSLQCNFLLFLNIPRHYFFSTLPLLSNLEKYMQTCEQHITSLIPPCSLGPTTDSRSALPLNPDVLIQLARDWSVHLDFHLASWKVMFILNGILVSLSPVVFKDATDYPSTRLIASVFVVHGIGAILFTTSYPYYFDSSAVRSAKYARQWLQASKDTETAFLHTPWVVMSFPLIATVWATVFFICGIVSFVLGANDTLHNEHPDRQPMCSIPFLALQIVILMLTVAFYVASFIWSYRALKMYASEARGRGASSRSAVDSINANVVAAAV